MRALVWLVWLSGGWWAVVIATVCGTAGAYEQSLKEENDSLRWQLDSYKNEVELLRREQVRTSRPDEEQVLSQARGPDVQIQVLQQSLHSMQQVGPPPSPGSPTCCISSSQTGQTFFISFSKC